MCGAVYVCMCVFSLTLKERYAERKKSTIHNETERIQTDEKSVNKLCSWRSPLFSIMKIGRKHTECICKYVQIYSFEKQKICQQFKIQNDRFAEKNEKKTNL